MNNLSQFVSLANSSTARALAAEDQDDWFTAAAAWRNAAVFTRAAAAELTPKLAEMIGDPLSSSTPPRDIRRDHNTTNQLAGIADHHA